MSGNGTALTDAELEVGEDPTPASVRGALDVVARHGYLTPERLRTVSPEELEAIVGCITEFAPALAAQLAEAFAADDQIDLLNAFQNLCGLLNRWFDQEATWNLHALPEEEREAVRTQPVNAETWGQLSHRVRWDASPRRFRRDAYCPALRIRRGGQRTRRVRRVASSPRRARAPSRLGDDPSEPALNGSRALSGVLA